MDPKKMKIMTFSAYCIRYLRFGGTSTVCFRDLAKLNLPMVVRF
jgi:hypothetical protein